MQVESALAVASFVPVLLNAMSRTSSECAVNTFNYFPILTSHNRQVPSIEEVAQYYPVNSNWVLEIYFSCPVSWWTGYPIRASHMMAVLSKEPVNIKSPSELKCKETNYP